MSKNKVITAVELRKKDEKSLRVLLRETVQSEAKTSLDMIMGKTKNMCGKRVSRRIIARIKTVIAEKQYLRLSTEKKV